MTFGPVETVAADILVARVLEFAGFLREIGFGTAPTAVHDAVAGLRFVDPLEPDQFRSLLLNTLCSRFSEWQRFDAAFDAFWFGRRTRDHAPFSQQAEVVSGPAEPETAGPPAQEEPQRSDAAAPPESPTQQPAGPSGDDGAATGRGEAVPGVAPECRGSVVSEPHSPPPDGEGRTSLERLRHTDFRDLTSAEAASVQELVAEIVARLPWRRRRRRVPVRQGRAVDLRATLHDWARRGEPTRLHRRGPQRTPATIVAVCDVSRSMNRYRAFTVAFCHALAGAAEDAEIYTMSTRLRRVTTQFRAHTLTESVALLAATEDTWSSGTTLGSCLGRLGRQWLEEPGRRPIMLIFSDGWDGGDAAVLAESARALRRTSRVVIWLNPRLGDPEFRPETAGMRAVLPHIDRLLACHDLASLESAAALLSGLAGRG